jgi:hypothetical protein
VDFATSNIYWNYYYFLCCNTVKSATEKYSLSWIANDDQIVHIKFLGLGSWLSLVGIIVALWLPRIGILQDLTKANIVATTPGSEDQLTQVSIVPPCVKDMKFCGTVTVIPNQMY